MFELDVRHFVATMLHPKYRQLRGCSKEERDLACRYIREEMAKIIRNDQCTDPPIIQSANKKQKTEKSILERYEDTSDDESYVFEKGSDDVDHDILSKAFKPDELTKYLETSIDKAKLSANPLDFWRANQTTYPLLARVARKIHCIPATSAAVERQFSSAGIVLNERRTCLSSDHLNDILLIRTMKNVL